MVSDWENVEKDDFYLSDKYLKIEGDCVKNARKLQKEGILYVAYIVNAVNYAIYDKMDANKVFIDDECNVVLNCESAVIGNDHTFKQKYNN